jgi:anthranilate synthase component I
MKQYKLGEIYPQLEQFTQLAENSKVIPVVKRVLADTFTPVGLYQSLAQNRPGTFLLESADGTHSWSRYSFVGVNSTAMLQDIDRAAKWSGRIPAGVQLNGESIEVLRQTIKFLSGETLPDLPPLTGGLVGYLAYDIVRHFEEIPASNPDQLQVPNLAMLLATDFAVLDHSNGSVWLIANAINYNGNESGVADAWNEAVSRLEKMEADLAKPATFKTSGASKSEKSFDRQISSEEFESKVNRAIEYIKAGDAFQIVLSQRFTKPTSAEAFEVYRALRATNPSPYMFFLRIPNEDLSEVSFDIVGSSPEALVTVKDSMAKMHPIAGTRHRAEDPEEDERVASDLLNDPKERAEHLMLVDLGRNDLGRVCKAGSVKVAQFMQVEKYSHVMHLVSTVVGELKPEFSSLDALRSTFPAGTLSGAPKVRAMEIIDELEEVQRGVYGGAVGYFDFAGNMDFAIAIRTAVLKDSIAYVQAGAGIVADSKALNEDVECANKAAVVMAAVNAAEGFK